MHIVDGVLTLKSTAIISAVSLGALVVSIKSLREENITLAAAMSAMFFIATFIHIPIGVTSIHLLLVGIIGILSGWLSFVSICIALTLQAVLLGFGGTMSIGVNLFVMATPAILVYYIWRTDFFQNLNDKLKFFLVGFLGVIFAVLLLGFVLIFSKSIYTYAAYSIFVIDASGAIAEGIVSMFLLSFIQKTYPKLLEVKK